MKEQIPSPLDDRELARVSADDRSVMVNWIIVFVMIALGAIAPSVAPLVADGYAVALERVAPSTWLPLSAGPTHS